MRFSPVFLLSALCGTAAAAEITSQSLQPTVTTRADVGTTFDWSFAASLSAGEKSKSDTWNLTERHGFTGALTLRQTAASGLFGTLTGQIEANPGIATSSRVEGAQASAEFRLGQVIGLGRSEIISRDDTINIYGSYRARTGFDFQKSGPTEFEHRRFFNDEVFGLGFEFQDIRSIICTSDGAEECANARNGWAWKASAGYSSIESNRRDREREILNGTLDITIPIRTFIPINVQAKNEHSWFSHVLEGDVERRRDSTWTGFIGTDVTHLLSGIPQLSRVTIGAQYTRNSSNLDRFDFDSLVGQVNISFGRSRQRVSRSTPTR